MATREVVADRADVYEALGLVPTVLAVPDTGRLTRVTSINKLNITDSLDPRVAGRWMRSEDLVRFMRAHARAEGNPFLNEIADQLRDHAGLPKGI